MIPQMAKKNNIITLIRIICNIQNQAPNANFLTCFQTAVKRVLMAYLDEKRALRVFMDSCLRDDDCHTVLVSSFWIPPQLVRDKLR